MSPAGRAHQSRLKVAGFTLVELMVVLAVISLILVFAVPALFPKGSYTEVKTGAGALAATLRRTRSAAVNQNRDLAVTVDVEGRRFTSGADGRAHAWPEDLDVQLFTAQRELATGSVGRIRFFADGSATGGRVTLSRSGRSIHVSVDGLTGGVSVHE